MCSTRIIALLKHMPDKSHNWEEPIQCYCRLCKQETNHDVLYSHKEHSTDDSYFWEKEYMIVKCRGCDSISHCDAIIDECFVETNDDGYDYIPTTYHVIPNPKEEIHSIRGIDLPEDIRQIYEETINSINSNNLILESAGCRATIEAICNHENISGANLEKKINNLLRNNIITQKDRDHLHAIRFIGNDSIHELKAFDLNDIIIVGEIINTILTSLYVIHHKFLKLSVKPISSYEEFIKTLDGCLDKCNIGDSGTLQDFLREERRIIQDDLKDFETKLISDIDSGNYKRLARLPQIEKAKKQRYKIIG